ncbi:MAG TPA: hypothetical protein VHG08_16400 [Longimicrobium sp.]|nr:hypothetical protein [Longimicrobium sp.]
MRLRPFLRLRGVALPAAIAGAPLAPLHAQVLAEPAPSVSISPPPPITLPRAPSLRAASIGPLPGTLEVGFSAGTAHTTRWYDADTEAGTVEDGTSLSAEVRYWPLPFLGLRLQASRFDGEIRTHPRAGSTGFSQEPQDLHGTAYDASVVVRPLAAEGAGGLLSSVYAYAGGGRAELEVSGAPDSLLVCGSGGDTACAVWVTRSGSVEQVTAGAGADLAQVFGFTLFAEASVHRYSPLFDRERRAFARANVRGGMDAGGAPRRVVVNPNNPAALSNDVVTRRFLLGLRRRFGRVSDQPPPPPRPPPVDPASPTRGGFVAVRTTEPGAEVYLVPLEYWEDHPRLACTLRPVQQTGSYFKGRTTSTAAVRVYADPTTWVLVVRQHGRVHDERIRLSGGRQVDRQLNMRVDGTPQRCPS